MPRSIDYHISPGVLIAMALSVLILPLRWLLAWCVAVWFHELCHYLAVRMCSGTVCSMSVHAGGIAMTVQNLTPGQELICALAGPVGSLLLLLLVRWFPFLAICALFQSAYNLMPLYPLDGGRVLGCFVALLFSEHTGRKIVKVTEILFVCLLWIGAIYCTIWLNLGFMPVILVLMLHLKTKFGKIPCKPRHKRVQ